MIYTQLLNKANDGDETDVAYLTNQQEGQPYIIGLTKYIVGCYIEYINKFTKLERNLYVSMEIKPLKLLFKPKI